MEQLITKQDLLQKLRDYSTTPDDNVLRFKAKIKDALLKCPELLYALNNKNLESELFNPDGTINAEYDENGNIIPLGEWDRYFGYNIRPYIFIPETQVTTDNFLCYTVGFRHLVEGNAVNCYMQVVFTILCSSDPEQVVDSLTGQPRHDLIGSIIREIFNWSSIFDGKFVVSNNYEDVKDTNYIARNILFEGVVTNGITTTSLRSNPIVTNYKVRR